MSQNLLSSAVVIGALRVEVYFSFCVNDLYPSQQILRHFQEISMQSHSQYTDFPNYPATFTFFKHKMQMEIKSMQN